MHDLGEIEQSCFLNLNWGYQHSVSEREYRTLNKNSMGNDSMVPISWSQRIPWETLNYLQWGGISCPFVSSSKHHLQLVWILENTLVMQHMERCEKCFSSLPYIPAFAGFISFFLLRSLQSFGVCSCFFGGGSSVKAIMLLDSLWDVRLKILGN